MSMEPPHSPDDDLSLTNLLSEDADEALQDELERLRPDGVRAAMNVLHSEYEAEDVVDEVIGRLFISQAGPGEAPLKPWFLSCVTHAAIDVTRRPARRRVDNVMLDDLQSTAKPFEEACQNETKEKLMAALARLSSDQRRIIRMRHFDEMKLEEIAHRLNRSIGATHHRLRKAEEQLRKNLKKGGGF